MSALEITRNFEKKVSGKRLINMDTETKHDLRSIVKDKDLHGYYKLKKADLVALLLEQSIEEIPTPLPRSKGKKRRPVLPVRIILSPQEIKNATGKVFSRVKNSTLGLHDSSKKTLKENKEKYISFYVKTKVKLAEVSNKDSTEVCKNFHLRFIDSFRFMALGLDKLTSKTWMMISVST